MLKLMIVAPFQRQFLMYRSALYADRDQDGGRLPVNETRHIGTEHAWRGISRDVPFVVVGSWTPDKYEVERDLRQRGYMEITWEQAKALISGAEEGAKEVEDAGPESNPSNASDTKLSRRSLRSRKLPL